MKRPLFAFLLLMGCSPQPSTPASETDSESDPTGGTSTGTRTDTTSSGPGDQGSTTGTAGPEATDGSAGGTFVPGSDIETECDIWEQDCPEGFKCTYGAEDSGSDWYAPRCTPLSPDPHTRGERCDLVDGVANGVDTCDAGLFCSSVDPREGGVCRAFCLNVADAPTCADAQEFCKVTGDGSAKCVPRCDPLADRPCSTSLETCVQTPAADGFVCELDGSRGGGSYGDPCWVVNECDPGLFCATPAAVPGCGDSSGCCSEFCDLNAPEKDPQCTGHAEGQHCLPWWGSGTAPEHLAHVGYCGLETP